jgi:hypothetical protein
MYGWMACIHHLISSFQNKYVSFPSHHIRLKLGKITRCHVIAKTYQISTLIIYKMHTSASSTNWLQICMQYEYRYPTVWREYFRNDNFKTPDLKCQHVYMLIFTEPEENNCIYKNNPWERGDMKFIFECSSLISHWWAQQFHISKRPCIILFII